MIDPLKRWAEHAGNPGRSGLSRRAGTSSTDER